MSGQRKISRRELINAPFRLVIDFPSYEDANCARELIEPMALGPITLRAKEDYFRPTMAKSPRMRSMRRALASRKSFDSQMIGEALAECGYSSTKHTISNFVDLATKHGVIERLEWGIYQFLPENHRTAISPIDSEMIAFEALMCKGCQPEPLSL